MSSAYVKRFEAVFLCSHPKGPKLSYSAAARYMKKSPEFVRKWVNRYKAVKNVDDFEERGKTRKTSKKEDKIILKTFESNPNLTLRQAQKIIAKKNIKVGLMTIKRRLQENQVTYRSTLQKPLLSEKHMKNRLKWARENIDKNWSSVIFTDESSFWAWSPKKRAWCVESTPVIQRTVKHPVKINVWGCFCSLGFGCLYLFTETLDAHLMLKIYQKALLKSAKIWFGEDNSSWILQEDNDPKHRSRMCTDWKVRNRIETLKWPSQSPDINPIENVWSVIKNNLRGKQIHTLKQLSYQIKRIWRSLPVQYAEKLVQSMPRRCEAICQSEGDFILY